LSYCALDEPLAPNEALALTPESREALAPPEALALPDD
jgi:hypothetical protein